MISGVQKDFTLFLSQACNVEAIYACARLMAQHGCPTREEAVKTLCFVFTHLKECKVRRDGWVEDSGALLGALGFEYREIYRGPVSGAPAGWVYAVGVTKTQHKVVVYNNPKGNPAVVYDGLGLGAETICEIRVYR